jgi:PTS system nitrogen regulatory IIA component
MHIADLLIADRVSCQVELSSKKRALEHVATLLANNTHDLRQHSVFNRLISREKLGSTALGNGVAIPHGRTNEGNLSHPIGAFIQLKTPVDFNAVDSQPVSLIYALLVPEESTDDHLQILAQLAEMFSNSQLCDDLRGCQDNLQLSQILSTWESSVQS